MENREIKFRAWDKRYRKMIFQDNPFLVITGNEILKLSPHHEDDIYYQIENVEDRFEIMQFVGLKDKDGKEIYHKDIGRIQSGLLGVIEWHNERGGWIFHDKKKYNTMLYERTFIEIIGNIYENPELIKE